MYFSKTNCELHSVAVCSSFEDHMKYTVWELNSVAVQITFEGHIQPTGLGLHGVNICTYIAILYFLIIRYNSYSNQRYPSLWKICMTDATV